MKNIILRSIVRTKIDARVDRLLREIGNPEPPLRLEVVRELMRLNRVYFSGDDDSLTGQMLSRLRVGGIQVFRRPALLLDAIKKLDLRALYLPDTKRILIDQNVPQAKQRWLEAHEIGHGLLPWHESLMLGDDAHTPTAACHEKLEAEANYAAGQLLFLSDKFRDECRSTAPSFSVLKGLKGRYGNSLSTTLWRYVECQMPTTPMIGVISGHPHPHKRKADFNPDTPCRHFIQSEAFASRFSNVGIADVFSAVAGYCGSQRAGPLGASDVVLADDNGAKHVFEFETFYNTHDALTLGLYKCPSVIAVSAYQ